MQGRTRTAGVPKGCSALFTRPLRNLPRPSSLPPPPQLPTRGPLPTGRRCFSSTATKAAAGGERPQPGAPSAASIGRAAPPKAPHGANRRRLEPVPPLQPAGLRPRAGHTRGPRSQGGPREPSPPHEPPAPGSLPARTGPGSPARQLGAPLPELPPALSRHNGATQGRARRPARQRAHRAGRPRGAAAERGEGGAPPPHPGRLTTAHPRPLAAPSWMRAGRASPLAAMLQARRLSQ